MKKFFKKITLFLILVLIFSLFVMFEMPGKIYGFEDEYVDEFCVSYMEPYGLDPYGKSYETTPAAVVLADTNGEELTNDIFGITPSQWNGSCSAYNDDVTVVIDLEYDGARLNKFEVRYMVYHTYSYGEISSATISVSDDNENWTSVGSVDVPSAVDISFQEAVLELDNVVNGRYVKFEIVKSEYTYVVLDELSVYASMPVPEVILVSNIDEQGKTYTTTPSANINRPDTDGKELTDGIFGIDPDEWNANCSAYDDDVTTVIDLGDNGARLYKFQVSYLVLHNNNAETNDHLYGEISSATISVSDDNENWTSLGSVDVPTAVDESFQKAVLELDEVVNGRYVKFEITKTTGYDFVALDELSVYALMPDIVVSNNWDLLPDGSEFDFWDCDTSFGTTYYVDNEDVNASDSNPGSESLPFETISKAASVAEAGDKVIIKEGVYFETIRDINGGTDNENMVLFEGQGDVVITGAVEWDVSDTASEGLREKAPEDEADLFLSGTSAYYANNGANVYMEEIPADLLEGGYNPFSTLNMAPIHFGCSKDSSPHMLELTNPLNVWNADPSLMKRGLLFCDGERMKQVVRPHELWEEAGTYWVDESGRFIHFRLPDNDAPSNGHTLELALKEQGFVPDESGLSYIYLKNLTFEKFSNPFPPPQKGVISTNCGHHWIIEDCTIREVNGVGLDMGFLSHFHLHDGTRGYHIVRGSNFINCGIGGIAALPTRGEYLKGMLVENNYFSGNCWHDTEPLWECAPIKNHYCEDCLYRNNIITDTEYGVGIWLDKAVKNTRVCNNIIINVEHSLFGGIQIEATYDKNLVDHNFIYSTGHRQPPVGDPTGGHGIYLGEVDNIGVYGNIILNLAGDGIFSLEPAVPRMIGTDTQKPTYGCGNIIMRNIIDGCDYLMTHLTRYNFIDENVMDDYLEPYTTGNDTPFRIRKENDRDDVAEPDDDTEFFSLAIIRQEFGWEQNGDIIDDEISVDFDPDQVAEGYPEELTAEITVNGDTQELDLTDGDEIYDYMANLLELLE